MADKLVKSTYFPESVISEMFSKVKGHSTVAKLAPSMPVAFNGNDIFVFSMDDEISIVGESGQKPAGKMKAEPKKIQPIKVIYQARLTEEFMYADEETRLNYMAAWLDGAAKKFARGLDLMAFKGVNPSTGEKSALITSSLADITNIVSAQDGREDIGLEDAIAMLGDYENTGYAFSKRMGSKLGKIQYTTGVYTYPEFRFGGKPSSFNGIAADVNSTIPGLGIVGQWDVFKWGYSKNVKFETIEFGDPDGLGDLKRTNEILLRAEAYLGFVVLDEDAFALVKEADGLSYDKNGGTGSMDATEGNVGDTVKVAANGFTPPDTMSFSKWNTAADGSGTDYDPNDDYVLTTGSDKLYAVWE